MDIGVITEILNLQVLLFMAGGVLIGIGFGSIPGLNTPMALAVVLPLTYGMGTIAAISTLLAVYCGGISGGLISAILLRMPGTAAAVVTTFDGYPMAQKGQAMRALGLGVISSFVGGMFSAIILMFLTPVLADVALGFGPWEFFGATALSLSMMSTLVRGDMVKGFIACALGMLIGTIGTDPIDGLVRFTFGQYQLAGGVKMVVMIIATFALSEVFSSTGKSLKPIEKSSVDLGYKDFFKVFKELKGQVGNLLRSSAIGTAIGILPGLAGSTASLMAYSTAQKFVKDPEGFGEGHPSGIVAPESANNAVSGGAMIPMLALGIPGSSPVALIMGAFMVHGVQIGPLMLTQSPEMIQTIFLALIVANILMLIFQTGLLRAYARVILVAKAILLPILVVFCVVGAFISNNSMFDVGLLIGFGAVAYILERNKFHLAPYLMGFVLGGYVELFYRRTVIYYESLSNAYFQFSAGSVMMTIAVLVPAFSIVNRVPAVKRWKAEKKQQRVDRRVAK